MTGTRRQQTPTGPDSHRAISQEAMCCFATAHHNCGHIHRWFARCFSAKTSNAQTCNMPSFPTWKYQEQFPCPACRRQRRAKAQELNDGKRHGPTPPQRTRDDGPNTVRARSTNTGFKQQTSTRKAPAITAGRTSSDPTAPVIEQYLRQVLGPPGSNVGAALQHGNTSLLHGLPSSGPAVLPIYNHQATNMASPAQMATRSAFIIPRELDLPLQSPQWRPPQTSRQFPQSAEEPDTLQSATLPMTSRQPEPGQYKSPYTPTIDPRLSGILGRAEESPRSAKKN